MSEFRRYLERVVIKDGAQPDLDGEYVPVCTEERCQKYDGKRCELMGARPTVFCYPALIDVMAALREEVSDV